MSVSAVGFYACAALVVVSAAATVGLRPARLTAAAAAALSVSLGLLLLVSGAVALALLVVALLLAGLGTVALGVRRGAFGPRVTTAPLGRWLVAGAVAFLGLVVLDGAALAGGDGWHRSGALGASLVSLIHFRAPITAGLLLVLGAVAAGTAWVIGRTSADELEWDRRRLARAEREERMRRRREDRVAARQQRGAARTGGG